VFRCIMYMALIFWDQKPESGPVDIIRVDTLLVPIERIDLYVSMVVVMVTVDSPGNKILDIRSDYGMEGDGITSSYRNRPSCRHSSDSELRAMALSLRFNLGNDMIIDAPTYACPLCSKTFLIKGASKMFIVDEKFNSSRMETMFRWWKSVTFNLIAWKSHKLRDRMLCMPWGSLQWWGWSRLLNTELRWCGDRWQYCERW
jgi:hypothetical protein